MRIAIIGGGISGLATAFYIQRLHSQAKLYLLEKQSYLGGTMRTVEKEGFLFETGSNGFLSNKPDTLELVKDSGADSLLLKSSDIARIRYIFTDRLHRLPENPFAFMASSLLSFSGKLRTLGEVFVPPRTESNDETLQSFGYRRVGKEFTDVFLNAMSAGIFASSPECISVKAAFPAVVQLENEYGGLFKGMIKKRKKGAGPGGVLMSFKGGMGRYIEHLRTQLNAEIRLDSEITQVTRRKDGYAVNSRETSLEVDKLILATPAYVSAHLLQFLAPRLAIRLGAIEYSPISIVGFGYHNLAHRLKGFGLLTTASAQKEILGVLWDSSIFPDRAPASCKSVRVMIGGQRNPKLAQQDESALVEIALKGLRETMGITDTPASIFVERWARGIPNYKPGHLANVDEIFALLKKFPGLYLNSNAYYGISLNDCVRNSKLCAQQVMSGE